MHALLSQLYMLQCIKQKAPINMLSRSKAPKTHQIAITDMQKRPVYFFDDTYQSGIDFSSRNNFANFGSLAKGSILVQSSIP